MKNFIGNNVVAIMSPQDRHALEIHVVNNDGGIDVVRFANDDGTPVSVDFSDIHVRILTGDTICLGEFEELNEIEVGFEIVGDFGIIWVQARGYSCHARYA